MVRKSKGNVVIDGAAVTGDNGYYRVRFPDGTSFGDIPAADPWAAWRRALVRWEEARAATSGKAAA